MHRLIGLLVVLSLVACDDDEVEQPGAEPTATATASATSTPDPGVVPEQVAAWQQCAERRNAALAEPALDGAPGFEKNRLYLTSRARGHSVLWRRAPAPASDALTSRLAKNESALSAVKGLLRRKRSRESLRKIFLRESYLYAEDADLALALVEMLSLPDLFAEDTIYLERGATIHELQRRKATRLNRKRYVYTEGVDKERTAEILLGDRVAVTREELSEQEPLVIDLRDAYITGQWDRIRPERITAKLLVADLRYGGDVWVPALFELEGAKATLACEALDAKLSPQTKEFIIAHAVARKASDKIAQIAHQQVLDELQFDADPEQSNGFLRGAWKRAYFNGWRRFTHEGKTYDVYTGDGRPKPPQVCIDFLTDTWEQAGGTAFRSATGDPLKPQPERSSGAIDFDKLDVKNRRSVAKFTEFTLEHPELFDVWELPKSERIRFRDRTEFFDYLAKNADKFQPADMLTIHGYKEGGRPHYHSLIVIETDPITGVPVLVAGNAVKPREQTIEGVMQISPKRTLRHRIRVHGPWLVAVAAGPKDPP